MWSDNGVLNLATGILITAKTYSINYCLFCRINWLNFEKKKWKKSRQLMIFKLIRKRKVILDNKLSAINRLLPKSTLVGRKKVNELKKIGKEKRDDKKRHF